MIQERNIGAEPLDGDDLYDVTCMIPDIGGSSPEEAAQVFYRILAKDSPPLYFEVRNTRTGETTTVDASLDD